MSGKGIWRNFTAIRLIFSVVIVLACVGSAVQAAITWSGDVLPSDPATWSSNTIGYIGQTSSGSIMVDGGNDMLSQCGYIGYDAAAVGTVMVTGAGSTWTNGGTMYVGNYGSGSLRIEAGGLVSSISVTRVAYATGSSGTVMITGTGSMWRISSSLDIGRNGNGIVNIEAGGQVSNTDGYVGYNSGATGIVTVNGADSKWTNSGNLYIGNDGSASLTVSDGGMVTVAKTLYASLNNLSGNGTITTNGAVLDADLVFDSTHGLQQTISFGNGGMLNLNVSNSNDLGVGYQGSGTLRIADGVTVSSYSGNVGYNAGSTGTVVVTGPGSRWSITDSLFVGKNGTGTLTVSDGGSVNTKMLYASVGNLFGNGTITTKSAVLDADLVFDASHGPQQSITFGTGGTLNLNLDETANFGVGYQGTGTMAITGARRITSYFGYLGFNAGSTGTVLVTGTGSRWTTNNFLFVGYSGRGDLSLESGGQVFCINSDVGYNSGSTSTVTVTGSGSQWSNTATLSIGVYGNGILNVRDGGLVASNTGYLGTEAGSTGTAVVTGVGSRWLNNGNLYVGYHGSGSLTVSDGGTVYVGKTLYASLSNLSGNGTITANGAVLDADLVLNNTYGLQQTISFGSGGLLTLNLWYGNDLGVGYKGSGSLRVADGLAVSSSNSYLGHFSGSDGTATVTGVGSKWTTANTLYVGNYGNGTLRIEDGGQVSNAFAYLGYVAGSNGKISVTGAGSKWTNNGSLYIGHSGVGALNIEAGGQVSSSACTLGSVVGSAGTASVSGSGSTWTVNGNLTVGNYGSGSLVVADGGTVTVTQTLYASLSRLSGNGVITAKTAVLDAELVFDAAHGSQRTVAFGNGGELNFSVTGNDDLVAGYRESGTLKITDGITANSSAGYLGYSSGSNGIATVVGAGSKWVNSNNLYVGNSGTGTLDIETGCEVSNATGYLGYNSSGSAGTVIVNGPDAKWTNNKDVYVGYCSSGTMNIVAGGQVSSIAGYLAYNLGSKGSVTVTGIDSQWTMSGDLSIGSSGMGIGTLNIEGGGKVSNTSAAVDGNSNFASTVTVSGIGSKWLNSGSVSVGSWGSGNLTIESGGQISSTTSSVGSYNSEVPNTVTITGLGSCWMNSGNFKILGNSTIRVEAGGQVSNAITYLGYSANSTSQITVIGNGTQWINTNHIEIGYTGKGTLNIEDGGQVNNSSTCYLGSLSSSVGTVTVTGTGSALTTPQMLYIGYSGIGVLNIEAGGLVSALSGTLGYKVGSSGTVTVAGAGSQWAVSSSNPVSIVVVGSSGSGTLNVGSLADKGGLVVAKIISLASQSSSTGTCNINNGGILQVAKIQGGAGNSHFIWNDGIIHNYDANTDLTVYSSLVLGLAGTGTHTFDIDAGRIGTINAVVGNLTSEGSLNKTGMGLLTLTATNTYSGATTVEEGRFKLTGSILNTSGITVEESGILELAKTSSSATASTVTIDNTGTVLISNGSQTVGSINGSGITQVTGSASLSAQSIVQNTLNIGGTGTASAMSTVPEPSTFALLLIATLGSMLLWRRQR